MGECPVWEPPPKFIGALNPQIRQDRAAISNWKQLDEPRRRSRFDPVAHERRMDYSVGLGSKIPKESHSSRNFIVHMSIRSYSAGAGFHFATSS